MLLRLRRHSCHLSFPNAALLGTLVHGDDPAGGGRICRGAFSTRLAGRAPGGGGRLICVRVTTWLGSLFGVVGAIYGVMLGFVRRRFGGNTRTRTRSSTLEGVSLRNLHRNSYALPATNQAAIRAALIAHAHAVIEDEWESSPVPAGKPAHPAGHGTGLAIRRPRGEPGDGGAKGLARGIHPRAQRNGLVAPASASWQRKQTVSGVMWVLLLFGGVATCGFMHAFGVQRFRVHLHQTATVAVLILLILYMIYALDNPFGGEPHLTPEAFIRFLKAHPTPE